MRIILVRHGETEDNVNQILSGQRDAALTERGHEQARLLGERLKSESLSRIYSSDLTRARLTAEAIGRHHACELISVPELRETCGGVYEGRAIAEFRAQRELSPNFIPPGGESPSEARERVRPFLSRLAREGHEQVVLAAHSGLNKIILGLFLGLEHEEARRILQHNTCVNLIDVAKDGSASVVLTNCTLHLEALREKEMERV